MCRLSLATKVATIHPCDEAEVTAPQEEPDGLGDFTTGSRITIPLGIRVRADTSRGSGLLNRAKAHSASCVQGFNNPFAPNPHSDIDTYSNQENHGKLDFL
jgi:hypothetical protein